MDLQSKRIGVALSGGGIRAAIFHLGALKYLASAKLFDSIASISTVSGASMAVALIFATNGNTWPNQEEFVHKVQPKIRKLILDNNIQAAALRRLPFAPRYWRHRVNLLAKILEEKWGINGTLQDLPTNPFWEINCTTFETGNNFRIRQDYMGDNKIGYVQNPTLPISHMVAASAAFPILIGPYVLDASSMAFTKDKLGGPIVKTDPTYTLWDGGVYDNLGLDPLYTTFKGLDKEIDYLIVSNATASIDHQFRHGNVSLANLRRLLDISMNQVDVLRSRQVVSSTIGRGLGMYFKIGYTPAHVAEVLGLGSKFAEDSSISAKDAAYVRNYPTTLNSPTAKDYDLIFAHGYEIAKCVHKVQKRTW